MARILFGIISIWLLCSCTEDITCRCYDSYTGTHKNFLLCEGESCEDLESEFYIDCKKI